MQQIDDKGLHQLGKVGVAEGDNYTHSDTSIFLNHYKKKTDLISECSSLLLVGTLSIGSYL